MPLLERKPFVRSKPPKDLAPNEDLFYCKITQEVFRDYEQFFERVILCNSLVWTCSLTGRSNLTFSEALESEQIATQNLRNFPPALKRPVLYLASLTERGRLNDMCDDVFMYVKDRYFVGEEVEASINGVKRNCEVTQVILPDRLPRSPGKYDSTKPKKMKDSTPTKIKYEVVDYNTGKTTIVKSESVGRLKGSYTKPKNKLFIKHHTHPEKGFWKVTEKSAEKLQLDEFQFSEAFAGSPPRYAASPDKRKMVNHHTPVKGGKKAAADSGKKTVQGKLNFKKETTEERQVSVDKQAQAEKKRLAAERDRQKARDNLKKQLEDDKERQRLEKLKEKEKKKEERKIYLEYMNSWKKPRDDLECDDLKELPLPTPIECGIPQSCFGDAIIILEFLNTFGKQIQIKNAFQQGFTFEHLEKALVETDIQGVFNDLLQVFLTALFQFQEADDDVSTAQPENLSALDDKDITIDRAMALAATVSAWPNKYHGTLLRNMPLDSFSITEVLRLHILTSGAKPRVNYQGISAPSEDPGLYFKMQEPELIKSLATKSVFQLNCEDRVKILTLLIHQLLNTAVVRYAVEENAEMTRPLRHQLKQLRWAYVRKQREDILGKKKVPQKTDAAEGENPEEASEEGPAATQDDEKENTDNLTPEEKAELEEKKAKLAAKEKAEFQRKEREIEAQIRKVQSSFNVTPLGRDRAYRRYWIFQSVAGVFIEDEDPFKGICLQRITAQTNNPSMNRSESSSSIKKYLKHVEEPKNGSSDKENEILRDIAIVNNDLSPLKNRKLSDLNPRVDYKKAMLDNLNEDNACLQCWNKMGDIQDNLNWYCPHIKGITVPLDQCTANVDTCTIHNMNTPKTKWAFYHDEEQLEELLLALNSRGYREGPLKEALVSEKERIKEIMQKCPCNAFNKMLPVPAQLEVRKSQRQKQSHVSSYANLKPQEALDSTLRDMILDLEHQIFAGGLGSLKVSDREAWRTALEQESYDMQCSKLSWGDHEILPDPAIFLCNGKLETSDHENVECNGATEAPIETDEQSVKVESSEVSKEKHSSIKDFACALLQVSQGIELKYLHPPLGESEEFKQLKLKVANEIATWDPQHRKKDCPKLPITALEKWQESLMQCTSTSQLFVHLGTLERSVAWNRSVLKAHCKICRRRGDAENMLLCDGCNRGHHLYCLKPTLEAIPEGDWFCLSCKPIEKAPTPQKQRSAESDSEAEDGSSESEYEASDDEEDEEDEDSEAQPVVEESCDTCGDVGTLICCDKCPLMFHPECIGLKRIPRGEWLCPKCTKKDAAVKKAQKHPTSGSYGTRSQVLGSTSKRSNPSIKTKIGMKGVKRLFEDSSDSEYAPAKKARKETNHRTSKENPFKKEYKDSAINTARRRSKTGGGDDMLDYKACIDLLVELMRHPSSWPFLVPVSKKDAPDYHNIIKRPMDFGTIRSKLNFMSYKNNEDFVRDIYLVLQNCEWFNPKSSPEFKAANVLYKEVKRLLGEYQLCNPLTTEDRLHNVNDF